MSIIRPPLAGNDLVRLIYLDEAGISNPRQEPYLVVAGVIVHGDSQWKAIEADLLALVSAHIPLADQKRFVFHATELYSGGKYFNREDWCREQRWKILDDLVGIIARHKLPIVCGWTDRERLRRGILRDMPDDQWAT